MKDTKELSDAIHNVLELMEEKFPQFKLNGTRNMWIVKPGGRSRGRGIEVHTNYENIVAHVKLLKGGRGCV